MESFLNSANANAYFGVFILFVLSFFAFNWTLKIQHFVSKKISSSKGDKLKFSAYECGPTPLKQQVRLSNNFFVIALLFVLFDVEVVFMIPWAMIYKTFVSEGLGGLVFIEMVSFIVMLALGLIYAYKKGALSWQPIR